MTTFRLVLTAFVASALAGAAGAQTARPDPDFPADPAAQIARLPSDAESDPPVDRHLRNAPLDRQDAPNTPMRNGGLPNGEGAPTGANTVRY